VDVATGNTVIKL